MSEPFEFARVPGQHSFIAAAHDYPMLVLLSDAGQVFYLGNFEPESPQDKAVHYLQPELIVASGVQDILPWAGGHLRHMSDGRVLVVRQEQVHDELGYLRTWRPLPPETLVEGRYTRVYGADVAYCALGSEGVRCGGLHDNALAVLAGHAPSEVADLALAAIDQEFVAWKAGEVQCWKLNQKVRPVPEGHPIDVRFVAQLQKLVVRTNYLLGLNDKGELWHWDTLYGRLPRDPRPLTHAGKVRDISRERGECIISQAGELLCYTNVHGGRYIPLIGGTPEPPELLTEPFRYGDHPPAPISPRPNPPPPGLAPSTP